LTSPITLWLDQLSLEGGALRTPLTQHHAAPTTLSPITIWLVIQARVIGWAPISF